MQTGRRIAATTTGCDLTWLGTALLEAGADLVEVPFREDPAELGMRIAQADASAILHCHLPPIGGAAPFIDYTAERWMETAEQPVMRTLVTLQAARIAYPTGVIAIGIGPAFAIAGTWGLTALATAAEAQRTLVKATARQWLTQGFSLNWLSLKTERLLPQLRGTPGLHRLEVGGAGRREGSDAELAELVSALAGPAARALAGQTLIADGGDWMTP